ncbi:N(G),N(G)-dimethylarginine dimethylaminohydrolase 1 [Oratosquilla oratoria]|uniref:N(G),N(G)-dimethylarginine dimethylaminohydrolase 1 n=1 Tax=Oratosquilla oratoria TaxID=337810 RepID=UPI003F773BE5
MSGLRYTHAIVCRIPSSYKTKAEGLTETVDLDKARRQHEQYVTTLREIGLDVIELPPDEAHPDGVFVEDTAVVCNGTALITRPGLESRKKEVEYMRTILKTELELPVVEIKDEKATIDGGDVLFTGREFFVGISSRTNHGGASALAAAFPEFPCTPIKVEGNLHLKSFMSMAGPDLICVGSSEAARALLKRVEREATCRYQILTVPDDQAANCVFVNGHILHVSGEQFPESAKVFEDRLKHYNLKPLCISEMAKAQGNLSCCSILVRKTRHLKNIM